MKTISWNCKGLRSPRVVRGLARLLKKETPQLVFLMEARSTKNELTKLKQRFHFKFDIAMDCRGSGRNRAGGLCLWWNEDLDIDNTSYSQNHIAGSCKLEDEDELWSFAGIYGYLEGARKKETWSLIHELREQGSNKIIFFGGLNDIVSEADKVGGISRSVSQLQWGRNAMEIYGLDGLPALFFQKYWSSVGNETVHYVMDILNNNRDLTAINNTFITLILKKKQPSTPRDFRPISLCNVIMKAVTKLIANRLKTFLPSTISEEHSAFIQGRLITNNALIAMECFHWMKHKKKGKRGTMALKLDLSKAYDRMEWSFMLKSMRIVELPQTFISLIQMCITTVSYQLLINGQPSKKFTPSRGLRQGDPLSPYLFFICAYVLSGMLRNEVENGGIHGVQVGRRSPKISHIFFADDSLLFARASAVEAGRIQQIRLDYEKTSGQSINADKSEVSFSSNVSEEAKDRVKEILRFQGVNHHSRYMGLPVVFRRSKKEVFQLVIEKVWKKVKGWKEKFLRRAGKEVLIKAVAQAIPTYNMSCYCISESCCKEIEAMLGKFFKGRYYPRCSIADALPGFNPSYAWRSILSSQELVLNGSRWRIGNGKKVSINGDKWIPTLSNFKPSSPDAILDPSSNVSSLIDSEMEWWNHETLRENIDENDVSHISSIPLSFYPPENKIIWHHESNGEYFVRSAYHVQGGMCNSNRLGSSSLDYHGFWKQLWKLKANPRIKNFMWRVIKNILPSKENLQSKGVMTDGLCPLCYSEAESTCHLFLRYAFVKKVIFSSLLEIRLPDASDIADWLDDIFKKKDFKLGQLVATFLWKIWKFRNFVIFKEGKPYPWPQQRKVAAMDRDPKGWVVQTDAGCFDEGIISFGCVICDPTSSIFLSATKRFPNVTNPTNADITAIRWALQMAHDLGIQEFVLQSDAMAVVDCINGWNNYADLSLIRRNVSKPSYGSEDIDKVASVYMWVYQVRKLVRSSMSLGAEASIMHG
ncbi:uncharacterized protein LOC131636268 [Vicia villosa]|uniref:uncharacterized protein LOC131636268 n=1 Tax=Vicia villosa TaxID=3911 RepID=UPI00273B1E51|nr:uncharacterized protein LOC131636268 [Vicia villosa]